MSDGLINILLKPMHSTQFLHSALLSGFAHRGQQTLPNSEVNRANKLP